MKNTFLSLTVFLILFISCNRPDTGKNTYLPNYSNFLNYTKQNLKSLQNKDGGFGSGAFYNETFYVYDMLSIIGELDKFEDNALCYLNKTINETYDNADKWKNKSIKSYYTRVACPASILCFLQDTEPYIKRMIEEQGDNGSWGNDAFSTSFSLKALCRYYKSSKQNTFIKVPVQKALNYLITEFENAIKKGNGNVIFFYCCILSEPLSELPAELKDQEIENIELEIKKYFYDRRNLKIKGVNNPLTSKEYEDFPNAWLTHFMLKSNLLNNEEKTIIASEITNILLPEQHECGAWDKDEIATSLTVNAVRTLYACGEYLPERQHGIKTAINNAVNFFKENQTADGGWSSDFNESYINTTTSALNLMFDIYRLSGDEEYKERIESAMQWIDENYFKKIIESDVFIPYNEQDIVLVETYIKGKDILKDFKQPGFSEYVDYILKNYECAVDSGSSNQRSLMSVCYKLSIFADIYNVIDINKNLITDIKRDAEWIIGCQGKDGSWKMSVKTDDNTGSFSGGIDLTSNICLALYKMDIAGIANYNTAIKDGIDYILSTILMDCTLENYLKITTDSPAEMKLVHTYMILNNHKNFKDSKYEKQRKNIRRLLEELLVNEKENINISCFVFNGLTYQAKKNKIK